MLDLIERYEAMKETLHSFFLDPMGRVLFISGENGTGKTYQVEKVARDEGFQIFDHRDSLKGNPENRVLVSVGGGKFGPKFLYEFLYHHRNHVIHFEENIFVQLKNRPLYLDLAGKEGNLSKPEGLRVDGLPDSFQFKGGIIITTYQPVETTPEEILNLTEVINVRVAPEPHDMIRLVRHELASIVSSYNKKMPDNQLTIEEATEALDYYEQVFFEEKKVREIHVYHMASIFWSFELLRTLTWPDYDQEIRRGAIVKSFDETPGLVTPGE